MERASPDRTEIEARLRRRFHEIWADVRRELRKRGEQRYDDLVQGTGDPEDLSTPALLAALNLSEIDRDIEELRAVQHAIARLKRGEYGICRSCGEQIDPARLEALPQAALCVDCKASAERAFAKTPSP
jgi:RNA polymerase-binding transcription factor